jgi:hypothetical protein
VGLSWDEFTEKPDFLAQGLEKEDEGISTSNSQRVIFGNQTWLIYWEIPQLKDRITPHVTNFSRFRLGIEKQEGKRKYQSDGAEMVGEFVCMYVQVQ